MKTATRTLEILLVEDSPDDIRLIGEALKDIDIENNLTIASDGDQAINYLKFKRVNCAKLPDVILLDLNMPKKNGHDVLAYMKERPDLNEIPVVVLTVSQAEQDILKALGLRMNYYINKPVNPEKLQALLSVIDELWSQELWSKD